MEGLEIIELLRSRKWTPPTPGGARGAFLRPHSDGDLSQAAREVFDVASRGVAELSFIVAGTPPPPDLHVRVGGVKLPAASFGRHLRVASGEIAIRVFGSAGLCHRSKLELLPGGRRRCVRVRDVGDLGHVETRGRACSDKQPL